MSSQPTADQPDPETVAGALTDALREQLYGDEHTATPHDVIQTIDGCLADLYALREDAVWEHRRRTDKAMARSAQLVAGDVSVPPLHGPDCPCPPGVPVGDPPPCQTRSPEAEVTR